MLKNTGDNRCKLLTLAIILILASNTFVYQLSKLLFTNDQRLRLLETRILWAAAQSVADKLNISNAERYDYTYDLLKSAQLLQLPNSLRKANNTTTDSRFAAVIACNVPVKRANIQLT